MPKLVDCFLYHNEEQLLEIRLQLLKDYVDRFVIVCSLETFTGIKKEIAFPENNPVVGSLSNQIDLIMLDKLEGVSAWDKESFSRNQLATKLHGLSKQDLVMVSDIDEIPRPSVIKILKEGSGFDAIKVLELDYFNFKFNYKMFHGLQAAWSGPTVCMYSNFTSPQIMRDYRWKAGENPDTTIPNAGWHFSYLTEKEDVSEKLASFSHQEMEVQSRRENISCLLSKRQGFHDHVHPGSVWGFIDISSFNCRELEKLVSLYPALYEADLVDNLANINDQIKYSMKNVCFAQRAKILRWCTYGELFEEIKRRAVNRVNKYF